jgi:hypothetical protein
VPQPAIWMIASPNWGRALFEVERVAGCNVVGRVFAHDRERADANVPRLGACVELGA